MPKVKLSAGELELVTDASFILTKNNIIQKVYALLGELSEYYVQEIKQYPIEMPVLAPSPKIARGENYEGLPWLMLDFPRIFSARDVFAIRTFFWWGNFFSITLQLAGSYHDQYLPRIKKLYEADEDSDWFLGCSDNAWEHHFLPGNYQPLREFSMQEIEGLPFIKLARKIPLLQWDDAALSLKNSYVEILSILGD
ncbi:hypothetical protein F5148DRAFT_1351063 [Russula earlei]|uniref:Uncharacterized protein n=1 Tax=Russula earlei TaxID=71964 RepID=A0ACC0TS89_9AGAM|nr:hypothetical protein F5148DRAFT_1351063 [Russula earlei]